MDAGPDALHAHEPPLGAGRGDPDLGPISPELALVDPELARRARELLPEPRERPRLARPLPAAPALAPAPPVPVPAPERQPEVQHPRRWARTLALAIVIFVAGAASGTFLGNHQTGSPAATLEVRAVAPATTHATAQRPALRPPKKAIGSAAPRRRRQAAVDWATNVLGVEASVGRNGVRLQWLRPADSARVLVLRRLDRRSGTDVVYRGRAERFQDSSVRPCTGYRYTIVNVDRRGHRSTGVPTSVVTPCA